jgi:hypothetical protein
VFCGANFGRKSVEADTFISPIAMVQRLLCEEVLMRGSVVKKNDRWYVVIEDRDPATGKRKRRWHSEAPDQV